MELRDCFMAWQEAAPQIEGMAQQSPRLSDVQARAMQLGEFGVMGLEALAFLNHHAGTPAGWKDAQIAALTAAEKPSALVRFVFLPAMRKLVEAAATSANQP
jgi:hexosaminidase